MFDTFLSVTATAISIRLLDDWIDRDEDWESGAGNSAEYLGERATPVYSLVSFSLGAALDLQIALSFFWASYALGMLGDMKTLYPSGLLGWQECLAIALLGTAVLGPARFGFALLTVFAIQLLDDLGEHYCAKERGLKGRSRGGSRIPDLLERLAGRTPAVAGSLLLLFLSLIGSAMLEPQLLTLALGVTAATETLKEYLFSGSRP